MKTAQVAGQRRLQSQFLQVVHVDELRDQALFAAARLDPGAVFSSDEHQVDGVPISLGADRLQHEGTSDRGDSESGFLAYLTSCARPDAFTRGAAPRPVVPIR